MSESQPRPWRLYVDDMLSFALRVLSYTAELDQDEFVADELTFDATLRNLELLGEAATHVPDEVRAVHPEIPWRLIVSTRNRLIHGYLGIDVDTVWSIVRDDVPALVPMLKVMREEPLP